MEVPIAIAFPFYKYAVPTLYAGPIFKPVTVSLTAPAQAMTRRNPPLTCCDGCHRLTVREVEVLRLVARGQTSRQIAEQLGIGMRTVNTYREHLKEKLEISTVAELTRYVIAHKIDADG